MEPAGWFHIDLTQDDVGGLRYLLITNHVVLENLIPGVRGSGTNATNFVTTTLRPGVDKITFQRMDLDPVLNQFIAITNVYTDSYVTNNTIQRQMLERVISKPDILFTAQFSGFDSVSRTGTTNWVNNGLPTQDGPGVIQPPIVINFNQLGPSLFHYDETTYPNATNGYAYSYPFFGFWGSFDGTTNLPVIYPVNSFMTNFIAFHLLLYPLKPIPFAFLDPNLFTKSFTWNLVGQPNAQFLLQTSTNLSDWVTITTITNIGGTYTYVDQIPSDTPQRFFRTIPQ